MEDARSQNLFSSLLAALVIGLINIIYTVSFSALIFNGPLTAYYKLGISTILFSYAISSIVMAAGSSLPGLIVTPKGVITAIVSIISVSLIHSGLPAAGADTVVASLFTCLLISAFLTGLFFFLLGLFRGGNLIRFIPFPVLSGYFGGVGVILISGSIYIMTGHTLTWPDLPRLVDSEMLYLWVPGLLFAVVCLAAAKRYSHFLTMPLLIAIGVLLFFTLSASMGVSVDDLRIRGYLMPAMDTGITWPQLFPEFITRASWLAVSDQWGHILSIVLISSISVLLYISITEVATGREIDLGRDLKAVGLAGMASSAIGGFISFHEPVDTKLSYRLGGTNRLVGVFFGAVCLLFVFGGSHVIGYFPKPIMGGLVLFVGVDLFAENLSKSWRQLPKSEFALVLIIVLSITLLGFLEGIGVGILVATVLFVVNYSRIDVVKNQLSGDIYHSKVERPQAERRLLKQHGQQLRIFILQGYIFFGTAERLLGTIRRSLRNPSGQPENRVTTIVLDFRGVLNIDSSALNAFSKLRTTADKEQITLILTNLNASIDSHFKSVRFFDGERTLHFAHLDYALEWCEEKFLKATAAEYRRPDDIDSRLEEILQYPNLVAHFKMYLERIELKAGDVVFRMGDPSNCLYVIESGRISTLLPGANGDHLRLRTMGAGTLVGEIGLYTGKPRSADAVADSPSTLHALSYERFKQLEREHPGVARQFHKHVVLSISQRMALDSEAMRALAP
ncbi:MAG: hypothetical protein AMJ54_04630 [Deltaproteobacteria bacterium SG8_13]|nr:MAG: hypothetical protein AMJ54_04630 [Deltaproteobacteria bacterium SG8_13]